MRFDPNSYMSGDGEAGFDIGAGPVNPVLNARQKLAQQIAASGVSPATAAQMAQTLATSGITDINQLGMVDVPYDTQVNLNGRGQYVDLQGNIVDPSKVTAQDVSGESGTQTVYTAPITTSSLLGNKETGQRIDSPFSTSAQTAPGLFGGEGNTGYHVNFDAQGNPKFSTSTIKDDNSGLASLATIGLSLAFPEFAPLIAGGSTALQGGNIGDVLKSAALGYAGQQILGGMNAPDVGPSQVPQDLPSDFNQYIAPTVPPVATSYPVPDQTPFQGQITDLQQPVATSYPVADQTPFQGQITNYPQTSLNDVANIAPIAETTAGTPISDVATMGPPTQVGSEEAIKQLQEDLANYRVEQQPILPTDVAATSNPAVVPETVGDNAGGGLKASTNPNLDAMNGGQGILPPVAAGIDSMGGATGILAPAVGGGVLGATGVNTGAVIGGGVGAGVDSLTGLPTPITTVPTPTDAPVTPPAAVTGMTPAEIAAIASGVVGTAGAISANDAIDRAQAGQNAAMQKSTDTLTDIYGQNKAVLQPYQKTGADALAEINRQMPYFTHQFDANDLNSGLAPNYQFMLNQGQMANQRAANVGGGALSGNTLTGLNRYTQDYAGNAYQNAFNNYNTQRNNIYNTLKGISDIGANANTGFINAGTSYGKNVTDLNVGNAAANAAAIVGKSANTGTAISNLTSAAIAAILGQKNAINPP